MNVLNQSVKQNDLDIYQTIYELFSKKIDKEQLHVYYSIDYSIIPLLIYENLPKFIYANYSTKTADKLFNYFMKQFSYINLLETNLIMNKNWELVDYIGLMSTSIANHITSSVKNPQIPPIKFTNLLSKVSQTLNNNKKILNICYKLGIKQSQFKVQSTIILEHLFETNIEKQTKIIKWLQQKNFEFQDIDKLIKFNNNAKYKLLFVSKQKKQIKQLFNKDLNK